MKVLIVTQALDDQHPILGFFVSWVREFAKTSSRVVVLASSVGTYSLPSNVTVYSLGKDEKKGKITRAMRLIRYSYTARKEYDVVFVHMIQEFVLIAGWLWLLLRKKIGLWYVHGSVSLRLFFAEKFVHHIFTTSPESFRLKSSKTHMFGHGIDADAIAFVTREIQNPLHVLSVGRISPSKHLDTVLDIFELFKKNKIPFKGTLIGGPASVSDELYDASIRDRAKKLGVIYQGPQPHSTVVNVLETADFFVSASETGSVDKAVLEAAAAGAVPIFSNSAFSNALGLPELLVDQTSGGFFEKIRLLTNDTKHYNEIRHKAREAVEYNHSLQKLIPRILKQY